MTRIVDLVAVPVLARPWDEEEAHAAQLARLSEGSAGGFAGANLRVRERVSEGVALGLVVEQDAARAPRRQVVWGDCVPRFLGDETETGPAEPSQSTPGLCEAVLGLAAPLLLARELGRFRELAGDLDRELGVYDGKASGEGQPEDGACGLDPSQLPVGSSPASGSEATCSGRQPVISWSKHLHTAVRYGVSQALLGAHAWAQGVSMAQVIAGEWDLPLPDRPVPILARLGRAQAMEPDVLLGLGLPALPVPLVDDLVGAADQIGAKQSAALGRLAARIGKLGQEGYAPTIHLDAAGEIGRALGDQLGRILGQLYAWDLAATPHTLCVRDPLVARDRAAQIDAMRQLRSYIRNRKMGVRLAAGRWVGGAADALAFLEAGAADAVWVSGPALAGLTNVIDTLVTCRTYGAPAYLDAGLACTHSTARVAAHVALAAHADLVMAGTGLNGLESIGLMQNEMAQVLAEASVLGQITTRDRYGSDRSKEEG